MVDEEAREDARLIRLGIERYAVGDMVGVAETVGAGERAAVVAGAEAFIYPALSEATALHALEALSLGVPVICSRAGALPEAVGSAGIVVEPRDPQRLAAAIEGMRAGALAQQLRRQAQRRATHGHGPGRSVARKRARCTRIPRNRGRRISARTSAIARVTVRWTAPTR